MQLFSPNMQVSFSSGAEFLKMFMFNFCHFLFKICRVPVCLFFDDFCSWRLKSCPWWLWCPACIILLVSSLYHQIQGSSCRPVLGNPCDPVLPCLHSSKNLFSFDFCKMSQTQLFQRPWGEAGAVVWDEVLLLCWQSFSMVSWHEDLWYLSQAVKFIWFFKITCSY